MKGIRDWVFTQVLSKSVASSRPLSGSGGFFSEAPSSQEQSDDQGSLQTIGSMALSVSPDASSGGFRDNDPHNSQQQILVEDSNISDDSSNRKKIDPLAKIEDLQIKFLRLLQRLGQSRDNLLVAKVLYRMHLATLIRAGESDLKTVNLRNERAKRMAREQEASGLPELDYPIKILVLGKTGVGKSATINSIFNQPKAETNAFCPATDCIREVVGTVNGIKLTFIDTPGFLPSSMGNIRRNRKIMLSVKRFIRRSPPDVVLYFERLDLINMGYSDFPLLKLMTEVFGSAIWFNTILVMTHSSPTLPEGPNGYPVSYESYVNHCTDLVQHYVHQAVSDTRLENPILLVENDPQCKRNFMGQNVLPNGQVWKSQFLLLCICTKVLADANALLKFRDSMELGPVSNNRLPSLPHLLSSFLRHRYRCIVTSEQWLARPVLDPHGWDHDVGFDGINLETALEVRKNVFASVMGQMNKDKHDFSVQSEFAAAYVDPVGPTYSVGLDLQSTGKDLMYTAHSNAKLRNLKHNVTDCGVSLTSFRNKYYVGAKLEDTILMGKRMKFVMNAGRMEGSGQVAYGGSFEATFRGSDYPVRNDCVSLSMTALSFNKETVIGGGFQSEFRPMRGMRLSINGNINSQKMGQVSVKMSSSEHVEFALVALFSICKALLRRMATENRDIEALEGG
ncbi:Avirulence induced family protein [Corchorus olitorius]|uniref:Avirulence induced family protein n=1 Tax=Corchorus olitorius TaxID=93759 RepID=A0A1R3JMN5_9ROSI|nr:Avirulence induced family protein [Corchorus olitorius]